MQKYFNNVQDTTGKAIVGAAITVNIASTGLPASIYSDNGVTLTTNPIYTSSTGSFSFYAADTRYNIVITYGTNSITLNDIIIEDPQDSLTFTDVGILGAWSSTTNGYNQLVIQNKSNGAIASSSFVAANDVGTNSTNYTELGMNSSGYSGVGSFNQPGYSYLGSASSDLVIGTYGNNNTRFVSGTSDIVDTMVLDGANNVIMNVNTAAPTLGVNSQMSFALTTNTNLRISVRGSDGVTRVANITLA